MSKFEESNFYKALQDFFINADKKTFLQFLAEFYNRTEGIIDKDNIQDDLIKELRELYLEFNEKGIDENIVREKVNYFLENNKKIQDIITKLIRNTNNIENITSQLDSIENKLNDITVSIKQFGAKVDGISDDSEAINNTIIYLSRNGGGKLILPPGKIVCNNKIVVPYGISIEGSNKGFNDRGTIIYRDEIINSQPIFELGTGGSLPFCEIKNLTIVGSTLDSLNHGITNNSVGLHGLKIEDVNFIHMAGTPIVLNSVNADARVEFTDIINCRSGVDWEGLKPGKTTKCINDICSGVLVRGNADSVRISRCNFISNNKKATGIKITGDSNLLPGDSFVIEKCGIYGNNIGIYSNAREIEIKNNYIENNITSIQLETRTTGVGEVITTINNNMFTSTNYCIDLIDNGTDARKSIHGTIFSNYVINKWDGTDTRFLKTLSTSKYTRIHCFSNGFTEVIESNGTIKFWASNSSKVGIYGQTKLDDFKQTYNLNRPKIFNDETDKYYYELSVNATDTVDNGLVLNTSNNERLIQYKKNSLSHYYYLSDGTRKLAYEMSSNGNVYFRQGISLYDANGNRYELRINSSGALEVVNQG